jgi:ribosomal protein S18 acetylase RimI-like enzyme
MRGRSGGQPGDGHPIVPGARRGHAEISFRPLSIDDAEIIAGIAASAFGPSEHRASEIVRYLTLKPNYWLLGTYRGQPAGVVGATDYGPFTYLGMMTVRKELQGRGIGRALFRRELDRLEDHGVSFLRLDATGEGLPIYLRYGFEVVGRAVMLHHPNPRPFPELPEKAHLLAPSDLEELAVFDAPIFGGDRTRLFRALLEDFPNRAFATYGPSGRMTGFLFAQPRRLGPWVARDPEDAESHLQAALTLSFEGPPVAVVPGCNRAAFDLLHRHGFTWKRESHHMHRGSLAIPGDRSAIYGLTSFAIG